ncbi:MAG: outer membrane protein assembly factor BamD [Bacteroidetes bacterium]|nr:outer membrane protein assembly factor BamD [Bacteroidota bacterium]MCZ2133394.1 outer membrane protein assembly factor BamD [Bacteroidota bacterium]
MEHSSLKSSLLLLFFICFAGFWAGGCSSSQRKITPDAASIFKQGMAALDDEDYPEAQRLFDVIRLQFPATPYADDAQYYLGESHYRKGEYILAAFNFGMIRRNYPNSDFVKMSVYKTAMCYYELSPPFDRDQDYTRKAIAGFSEFQAIFPTDSLADAAGAKITGLRGKLAHRDFNAAENYRKMTYNRAAISYYEMVIDDYPDTEFCEPAYLGKMELLVLGKRFAEAHNFAELYLKRYPAGRFRNDFANLETQAAK